MLAGLVSGTIAAILVLVDFSGIRVGQMMLSPFRTQAASVGAQLRASGSFQYPTIASMFLEVAFAFGAAWLPVAVAGRRSAAAAALLSALLLIAGAITLTYTRAGLLTMGVTLVLVAALHLRRAGWDRSLAVIAGLAAAVAAIVAASRPAEAMRLRMTTEGLENWYRASIDAPAHVPIGVGKRIAVPLSLTNTGQVTWDSSAPRPFGVSYHWLLADADRVVSWEGRRASFPHPVPAGESVAVTVELEAPRQPGEYRIVWDLYQEDLLWFSTEPGAELSVSRATVSGDRSGAPLPVDRLAPMPRTSVRPSRLLLWRAAGRMLVERPWLGVGPDNFRLRYGPYAGLTRSDPRVHTNNMYVELIVGGGLLSAGALVWLLWRVAALAGRLIRRRGDAVSGALTAGAVAAAAAIALHGLVDSFLSFTATYSLIGISLGLLAACGRLPEAHAHRI
jgi:O-antigen ligase